MAKSLSGKKIYCRCGKHVGTYQKARFDQLLEDLLGPGGGVVFKVEYTDEVFRNKDGMVAPIFGADMRYCKDCAKKAGLAK